MSLQRCPVCEGKGTVEVQHQPSPVECPTCDGVKMVDEKTGKPPKNKNENKNIDGTEQINS